MTMQTQINTSQENPCAQYMISERQKIIVKKEKGSLQSYIQTQTPSNQIIQQQITLKYPQGFDPKQLAQVSDETLQTLLKTFYIKHSNENYELFCRLVGGGGVFSKAKTTGARQPSVYKMAEDQKQELAENKERQLKQFLIDRDGYPKSKPENIDLAGVYSDIAEKIMQAIQEERHEQKLHMSDKNFERYLNVTFAELENQHVRETLSLTEERPQATQVHPSNKPLAAVLNKLIEEVQKLYNEQEKPPHLHNYQKRILKRWILETVMQQLHLGEDVASSPFYHKVAHKLSNACAKAKDHNSIASIEEALKKLALLPQKDPSDEEITVAQNENTPPWHETIKTLEKKLLRKMPWQEYTTTLLVKHYNLITHNGDDQNPTDLTDKRNKEKIEQMVKECLTVYLKKEDHLTVDEFSELIALGGIKHHLQDAPGQTRESSQSKTLFHQLLARVLADIRTDELFEPEKIQALAFLIGQVGYKSEGESPENSRKREQLEKQLKEAKGNIEQQNRISAKINQLPPIRSELYCSNEDLKSCVDVLKCQLDRLLFTSQNTNVHLCLDSLNLLLNIMSLKKIRGFKQAQQQALQQSLESLVPTLAKKAFNFLKEEIDPSLRYKAEYAKEALKRIDPQDAAYTAGEALLVNTGPTILSMISGAYQGDTDALLNNLQELGAAVKEYYNGAEDWFDQVNKMKGLSNVNFELFEQEFFGKEGIFTTSIKPTSQLLFFTAHQLDQIARNRHRSYKDRRRSIELLGNLHSQCWQWDKHTRFWIHRQLSALAQKPPEDIAPYDTSLTQVALQTMRSLEITPLPIKQTFTFSDPKLTGGNSLLKTALKNHLTLDAALSELQQISNTDYEKTIKPLHLIQIEGKEYKKGAPLNDPATTLQNNALQQFLNPQNQAPVWLIQGDAGTGKSIFLQLIEKKLWNDYKQGKSAYLPIFVRLSEVKNPGRCIEERLQNLHYSKKIIQEMKELGQEGKSTFLFIFDGYDELKAPKNLYNINKLEEFGIATKMIITSREEYLKAYGNYQNYFKPQNNAQLFEHRIADITEEQRNVYIEKAVKSNNEKYHALDSKADKREKEQLKPWTQLQTYTDKIDQLQGLNDLIKTPYMLKIITDILPQLDEQSGGKITKARIYKAFTTAHFEREGNRLLENNAAEIPRGYDLETSFYNYSKDLALRMWLLDKTSVTSESDNYTIEREYYEQVAATEGIQQENLKGENHFNRFFQKDSRTSLARAGAPLIVLDNQARFAHKSILEYFAARFFYDDLKNFKTGQYEKIFNIKPLQGSDKTDQESDVLNFLVEMIKDNHNQQTLLKTDDKSDEKGVHIIEFLKEFLNKKTERFLGDCDRAAQNILQLAVHFPEVIAAIEDDKKKKIESNETINLALRAEFCKAITQESYARFQSSGKKEDKKLYKEYAQKSLTYASEERSIVEYVKEIVQDSKTFQGNYNHDMLTILLVAIDFPEVIEYIKEDVRKAIEKNETIDPSLKADFYKAMTQESYVRFQSSNQQEDEDLYKEYAQKSINYALKGTYAGPYKKTETGLWIADTSESAEQGRITFQSGDRYSGSWLNNKFEGQGTLTDKEGLTFTGTFVQGQKQGEGFLKYSTWKGEKWKDVKGYKGVREQDRLKSGSLVFGRANEQQPLFEVQGEINPQGFNPDLEDVVRLYDAGQAENLTKIMGVLSDPVETQRSLEETSKSKEIWLAISLKPDLFGAKAWGRYFGEVGEAPPLPENIRDILFSPCTFWPDKKVRETHMLVLIPNTVNGQPLHLDALSELIKQPKVGHETQYRYYGKYMKEELGEKSDRSHWVLMTRDVIPESLDKTYDDQKALVQGYAQQSGRPYELPTALEATTAILMNHVQTGEKLYMNYYTRCQETMIEYQWPAAIGGFSAGGLSVDSFSYWRDDLSGVGCVWKL
ncbi:MAG: NACHT domain-containing protein [Simkaniaceae bacterium]|nr:NACHT domain-containing protein [Simkaniaceae bacterium]